MSLAGKGVLITGAARRIGRALAFGIASAGGIVVIHHGHSRLQAEHTQSQIQSMGGQAYIIQADLSNADQASRLIDEAQKFTPLYALVNNAAIFEPLSLQNTDLAAWNAHLTINLTAPFILSQSFARVVAQGKIVNILDWRALRPQADHLPYTISKAGLAALTRSLAVTLAPRIQVNGLALGAVLPPSDGRSTSDILDRIPAKRWAELEEVSSALLFLLDGPDYITGEILHIDGGRHLI